MTNSEYKTIAVVALIALLLQFYVAIWKIGRLEQELARELYKRHKCEMSLNPAVNP